ncbi:hypothetical protein [Ruegeria atlantica]|uniref:hypothetical protein n=1 Tax=Ruegeria atlantica TaxID=81569 RepID=UPI00147A8F00|nr:hypothetical protein [Ruegeria atlantica]
MIQRNEYGLWEVFVGKDLVARVSTREEAEREYQLQNRILMEKLEDGGDDSLNSLLPPEFGRGMDSQQ